MKTNEAPEKIYVANNVFPSHVDWDGSPINTKRIDVHDIEYTRTDAFIKKATEWLKKNADNYMWYDETEGESGLTDDFINDFKNYMKGENKV